MPELPEVETIKRDLESNILGKDIISVKVIDSRVIRGVSRRVFSNRCRGQRIKNVKRRGKAIIFTFSAGGFLVVQPMMTGQLVCVTERFEDRIEKATKLIFTLSNGVYLLYNDQRLFGRVTLADDLDSFAFLKTLGVEPLEKTFSPRWLENHIQKKKTPIKTLLMDQRFIAGIGNIYASEILFRSRIDPRRSAGSLNEKELRLLHRSTVAILKEAVKHRGTSMRNYRDGHGAQGRFKNRIKVYAKESESCPDCCKPIQKIVQAGRSTFFCQTCQR